MANVVSIEVRVDNAQAQQALAGIQESLAATGTSGSASLKMLQQPMADIDKGMLTNRESVRLASEELGLRIPRAMQSVISHSELAMGAINALSIAMVGIGFASIGIMIGKEIYDLYEKWLDVGAAEKQYADHLDELRTKDFTDTRSIDTTIARIREATQLAQQYKKTQDEIVKPNGWFSYFAFSLGPLLDAKEAADGQVKAQEQSDELTRKELDQQHKLIDIHIDLEHSLDKQLPKEQQITAEHEKRLELMREEDRYSSAVEGYYGNKTGYGESAVLGAFAHGTSIGALPNLHSSDEQTQEQIENNERTAQQHADAAAKQKQMIAELTRLQGEADEAGLKGIALMEAKREAALDDFKTKFGENAAAIAAINKQYHAQEMAEIQEKMDAANKAVVEAQTAGLTGMAKIDAEHKARTTEIWSQGGDLGVNYRLQQAADITAQQDRTEEQARLDKEAQEKQDRIAQTLAGYDEQADNAQASSSRRGRSSGNPVSDAFAQQQAQVQRIDQLYQLHYQKLQEQAQALGMTDAQVAQANADLVKETNAQIEQSNDELRDRIAGSLESAFKDPVHFIQDAMQKMMFQMIADWIMQLHMFKGALGDTFSGAGPGAQRGGVMGQMLGGAHGGGAHGGSGAASAPSSSASSIPGGLPPVEAPAGFSGGGYGAGGTFTGGGGGSNDYASTTAGSGGYAGVATPGFTASAGPGFSSLAGSGASLTGSLHSDYAAAHPAANTAATAGLSRSGTDGTAATAGTDNSFAPGTFSSSNDTAGGVNNDLIGTKAPGGITTGGSEALGVANAGLATYGGAQGIWGGIEQTGGSSGNTAKGIASATLAGAGMGASIGALAGPEGALIGAAAGAALGLTVSGIAAIMGEGGHLKARKYFHDTLDPQIQHDVSQFRTGGGDFQSAIAGVNKTAFDGMQYAEKHFGQNAANYMWNTYLKTDMQKADTEISNLAKSGSAGLKASAAQFHDGGTIAGFGSYATSSTEGFIHALLGETVMNQDASTSPIHGPALAAINKGADPVDIAAHYLAASGGGNGARSSGGGDTHHHWDVSTLDAKSFSSFLQGGGMQTIMREQNKFTGDYSGAGRM